MALIAAVLVTMIVVGLAGIAAQSALHGISSSAVALKLVQASSAAESGIDATIAGIQSGSELPPCGAQTQQALGPPADTFYTVTITYYDSSGTSMCTQSGVEPSGTPASALVQSVGTTGATQTFGNTTWEAYLKLSPSPPASSGFDQAIYSDGSLSFTNRATLYGDAAGNDANIYADGDFTCTNQLYNYGNVYAQGDIEATNQCGSAGSWWAGGSICDTGKGAIAGSVMAAGDVSGACKSVTAGTISMGSAVVAKGAIARSLITPWPCPNSKIEGSCSENTDSSTNPGPPSADPFPLWSLNTSTWKTAGYTIINDTTGASNPGTPCSSSAQVYKDLAAMSTAGSSPTLIYTDCQIQWNVSGCPKVSGLCTWSFANNLAIVDIGGYSATNSASFQSTSSTEHYFYMLVPYDQYGSNTATQCGSGNGTGTVNFTNTITTGGTGNANPLGMLIYTPCNVSFTNSVSVVGQIYSGTGGISVTNNYTMQFQLVPVPGYDTAGSGNPSSTTYTVALVYKRQD